MNLAALHPICVRWLVVCCSVGLKIPWLLNCQSLDFPSHDCEVPLMGFFNPMSRAFKVVGLKCLRKASRVRKLKDFFNCNLISKWPFEKFKTPKPKPNWGGAPQTPRRDFLSPNLNLTGGQAPQTPRQELKNPKPKPNWGASPPDPPSRVPIT